MKNKIIKLIKAGFIDEAVALLTKESEISKGLQNLIIEYKTLTNRTAIHDNINEDVTAISTKILANLDFSEKSKKTTTYDFGLVIALKEEFEEIMTSFKVQSFYLDDVNQYFYEFSLSNGAKVISCFMGEMGPTSAGIATERLFTSFKFKTLVNVGIAGSLANYIKLGDVIVASQVDGFSENAKIKNSKKSFEFNLSGEVFRPSPKYTKHADNISISQAKKFSIYNQKALSFLKNNLSPSDYKLATEEMINTPFKILSGKIASSQFLNTSSNFTNWLKQQRDRHYIAIEMEAFGILKASEIRKVDSIIIRGISDPSDAKKEQFDKFGNGVFRKLAMKNAISVLDILSYSH